jgi:galactose mutarotase-like enzyme
MTEPGARVSIASRALSAEIDPLGAQLFALRDQDGQDLLWDGDPAVWSGRAPILFPIVGALARGRYRLDGAIYELPRHGFARRKPFAVVEASASSARLRLSADDETRTVYPFEFQLDLIFALAGAALTVSAHVRNLGEAPMPASFGFHPAFLWPLPYGEAREAHVVRFDEDEPSPVRRLNTEGLVAPGPVPTPVAGRSLAPRDEMFAGDALVFDALRGRGLSYGGPEGPRIRLDFPDTPYFGVWTKPGAGFLCLEPWCGIADPEGFDGDFRAKPGVFEVAPGQERRIDMLIGLER